ncbi:MAG TPA: RNA polymerase-binding protein DksA [Steroidobacteraceae bacterium]|nr:RNA polymerase-binding protein DksA [Steroidobacteraceae bacterium]
MKAAPRKAPAPRKAAKPAARKPKAAAARAKPAKPVKTKSRAVAAAPPRAPAKPVARSGSDGQTVREPVQPKPRMPAPHVAEVRATFSGMPNRMGRRLGASEDEEDGTGTHNLLLGPRNVRPYRERKGELYMGRDQLDHFRDILSSWKRDLMEEVDRTMSHMKDEAANPPDPNDRATLESEFALELRTRDRERKLIRKIDEALSRIEDGSYGYCIETGEPIGVKRLEARPVATLCIEAQERRERREKQYGDRDDWYR